MFNEFYFWNYAKALQKVSEDIKNRDFSIYLVLALVVQQVYNDLARFLSYATFTNTGRPIFGVSILVSFFLIGALIVYRMTTLKGKESLFLPALCTLWFASEVRFFIFFVSPVLILKYLSTVNPVYDLEILTSFPVERVFYSFGFVFKALFIYFGLRKFYRSYAS